VISCQNETKINEKVIYYIANIIYYMANEVIYT